MIPHPSKGRCYANVFFWNAKNLKSVLSFEPGPRPPFVGSETSGLLLVHSVQKRRHSVTPPKGFGSSAAALGGPPTRRATGSASQRAWLFSARSDGLHLRDVRVELLGHRTCILGHALGCTMHEPHEPPEAMCDVSPVERSVGFVDKSDHHSQPIVEVVVLHQG
jgi:hypothetical protein